MQSLRSLRRGMAFLSGVCGMVALVTLGPAVPAVNAQTLRDQIPIVAGSALELPGARWCSAGVVLESRSWLSRVVPIARATRYIALAEHCATLGTAIRVGGREVGTITWVSQTHDLEILTVPPSTVQRPHCVGASQLHNCTLPPATPKALGRVILDRGGREQAIPVHGMGTPASDERFCTSGAISFVNCGYHSMEVPPVARGILPATARNDDGRSVIPGDSGGPVASINGTIYGIILAEGHDEYAGTMGYLPIGLIAQDLDYAYDLAPA